ncbi:MAG: phosphatase PAP2 family protein [Anaerolineae bacterium]
MNPDVSLFHLINNLAGVSPALDWITRALVNDYAIPTLFALVLGALWFTGETEEERQRIQRAILLTLIAVALTNLTMRILQNYYFRPRPFAVETGVHLLFYRPSVSSFPSVPVATLFVYVAGLRHANGRVSNWLCAAALAFGLARILAGVHYPSDIVGGALLGIIGTRLLFHYARFFDPLVTRIIRAAQHLDLA